MNKIILKQVKELLESEVIALEKFKNKAEVVVDNPESTNDEKLYSNGIITGLDLGINFTNQNLTFIKSMEDIEQFILNNKK